MNIRELLDQPRDLFESYCESLSKFAYLGDGTGLARVLGKYKMFVSTEDTSITPHLILDGCWEPWVTLALSRLKKGCVAVDVGANQGYYTLLLADLCGKAVACEPQETLTPFIEQSAKLNGFQERVQVLNVALGKGPGSAALDFRGDFQDKCSVLVKEEDGGEVIVETLDSMRFEERVGFIKMDAEGMEPDIWEGAQGLLAHMRPTIAMEFSPSRYEDPEGFLKEIQRWYSLQEIDVDGGLSPVSLSKVLEQETMLWLEDADV